MSPVWTITQVKIQSLRHGLQDPRQGALIWVGASFGLLFALATVAVAVVRPSALPLVLLGWGVAWALGPALVGTANDPVNPRYFALVPLSRRRLLVAVGSASFVGVGPAVSVVALLSLVVVGARRSASAAVVAAVLIPLQLALFVALGRVCSTLYALVLRRRTGAVVAGGLYGVVLAFGASGWAPLVALTQGNAVDAADLVAARSPSGWGEQAVLSTAEGSWGSVLSYGALLAATTALLACSWFALVARSAGATRPVVPARVLLRASGPLGAAVAKDLRSWSRDPLRSFRLSFAAAYGVAYCALPLAVGWTALLPWAGAVAALMGSATCCNTLASDGTALWVPMLADRGLAREVRARQVGFILVIGTIALVLANTGQLASHSAAPPPILWSTTAAVVGVGAGVAALLSVVGFTPGRDLHTGSGNPLESGGDPGQIGWVFLGLLGTALLALPATLVAARWGWWGLVVGLLTGAGSMWWGGALAERRVVRDADVLLTWARTGLRPSSGKGSRTLDLDLLPTSRRLALGLSTGLGFVVLIAQGVVPMALRVSGIPVRSWFLGQYLPDPWSWATMVGMVVLGACMIAYAVIVLTRVWRQA